MKREKPVPFSLFSRPQSLNRLFPSFRCAIPTAVLRKGLPSRCLHSLLASFEESRRKELFPSLSLSLLSRRQTPLNRLFPLLPLRYSILRCSRLVTSAQAALLASAVSPVVAPFRSSPPLPLTPRNHFCLLALSPAYTPLSPPLRCTCPTAAPVVSTAASVASAAATLQSHLPSPRPACGKPGVAYKVAKEHALSRKAFIMAAESHRAIKSVYHAGKSLENASAAALALGDSKEALELVQQAAYAYRENGTPAAAAETLEKAGGCALQPCLFRREEKQG